LGHLEQHQKVFLNDHVHQPENLALQICWQLGNHQRRHEMFQAIQKCCEHDLELFFELCKYDKWFALHDWQSGQG
jgi:hypothetical protein